jgi:hypothetical protein
VVRRTRKDRQAGEAYAACDYGKGQLANGLSDIRDHQLGKSDMDQFWEEIQENLYGDDDFDNDRWEDEQHYGPDWWPHGYVPSP